MTELRDILAEDTMAKKRRRKAGNLTAPPATTTGDGTDSKALAERACTLSVEGQHSEARRLWRDVEEAAAGPSVRAQARNGLAVLAAVEGDLVAAEQGFGSAVEADPEWPLARDNLALLLADRLADVATARHAPHLHPNPPVPTARATRVAILSFLFNWPSTGGGNVHTAELALFLHRAGYDVRHFYARYAPWGIGRVQGTPYPAHPLDFDEGGWTLPDIQAAFRRCVDDYAPDHVIITDSWNIKPHLAAAVRGYRYSLRFQAMECLCPLNNVRLLPEPDGTARQCPLHQLATPDECGRCLHERGRSSGSLHQAERELSGVGTPAYHEGLLRAFRDAKAVLVVNPLTEAMVSPYARSVRVVTAGMDPARFPAVPTTGPAPDAGRDRNVILFAGLVDEWMKGFHVLRAACSRLGQDRADFELVATADPAGRVDEFTRLVGWQSQDDLPRHISACDILVIPTLAQEALGRTAVEAMAAGKPVVASRLGGLTATVADGATGLLFEPGDPADLARNLATLLDDPELRRRLGAAGRKRFEEQYAWAGIVERHYKPLLGPTRRPGPPVGSFAPVIPARVDQGRLAADVAEFFELPPAEIEERLRTYRAVHAAKGYARTLGEHKTLCFEEAFVLYVLLAAERPRSLVFVGPGDGAGLRRLLDAKELLGLDCTVASFDAIDRMSYCKSAEANLVVGDLQDRFAAAVLDAYEPGLIITDVHTYPLLSEIVSRTLAHAGRWLLALHDCGRGLCNPRMGVQRNDPNVTSATGVWERYVLAEAFGLADPLDDRLDRAAAGGRRLQIFTTPHGLGVIRRIDGTSGWIETELPV